MSGGASSGMFSHSDARFSGSGRSSVVSCIQSHHSDHDAFPHGPLTRRCRSPERMAPGILDRRLGFLFCVSMSSPFLRHTSYRRMTRSRYSL